MKEIMGIEGNGYSEAVQRALVDFGSEKSFERASWQFCEYYKWDVGWGTILNHTERVARDADDYVVERLKRSGKCPSVCASGKTQNCRSLLAS